MSASKREECSDNLSNHKKRSPAHLLVSELLQNVLESQHWLIKSVSHPLQARKQSGYSLRRGWDRAWPSPSPSHIWVCDWGVWIHCHLPVALGRRGGRETPRIGRYSETQKIPSSRTLLVQVGPHFVCISSVLFAVCGSGREQGRLMLNHVRSLLPPPVPAGGGEVTAWEASKGDSLASLIRRSKS